MNKDSRRTTLEEGRCVGYGSKWDVAIAYERPPRRSGARQGRPDTASLQDVERLRPSPASSPHRGHHRGVHAGRSTPRNAHRLALPPLPRRRRSAATNWTTRPGPVPRRRTTAPSKPASTSAAEDLHTFSSARHPLLTFLSSSSSSQSLFPSCFVGQLDTVVGDASECTAVSRGGR